MAWIERERVPLDRLLSEQLLPIARAGLAHLQVSAEEIEHWLGIVERRVATRQTGAAWQRAWVARHGRDFQALMQDYLMHQESGKAVHEWPI